MLQDIVTKGAANRSVTFHARDASDHSNEDGIVAATPGLALWYRRDGGAKVALAALNDLASLTTEHTDQGLLHIDDGVYRLDLPDGAFATGANYVDYGGTATGMVITGGRVRLTDLDLESASWSQTRDFEEVQQRLRIPTRSDGSYIYSPDVVSIAAGETLVVGFDCRPDGRPSIVCPGRAYVAEVAPPTGLSGELSAEAVGTDGHYAKVRVSASALAVEETEQWLQVEVRNSYGDGPVKLSARVVVRAATGG